MTTIKIDNKDYELDSLSQEAKSQLSALQFCDQELSKLQAQAAVYQTARIAYAKALTEALPVIGGSDTLKLS
jgi:hypothetical protein